MPGHGFFIVRLRADMVCFCKPAADPFHQRKRNILQVIEVPSVPVFAVKIVLPSLIGRVCPGFRTAFLSADDPENLPYIQFISDIFIIDRISEGILASGSSFFLFVFPAVSIFCIRQAAFKSPFIRNRKRGGFLLPCLCSRADADRCTALVTLHRIVFQTGATFCTKHFLFPLHFHISINLIHAKKTVRRSTAFFHAI